MCNDMEGGDIVLLCFFFQAEDGIRDWSVTGVQTCALPIYARHRDRFDVAVLPRERLLRGAEGTWMPLSDEAAHAYAAAAAGLKPLPASRLALRDAPESRGMTPAGDGFPWLVAVILVAAVLTGGALTPPARRLVARLVA